MNHFHLPDVNNILIMSHSQQISQALDFSCSLLDILSDILDYHLFIPLLNKCFLTPIRVTWDTVIKQSLCLQE